MRDRKPLIVLTLLAAVIFPRGFAQSSSLSSANVMTGPVQPGAEKPQLLTLQEAIALTVSNHPLVEEARAELAAAQAAVGQAHSSYYPSIAGSGSYTRVEPNESVTFPGLGTFSLTQADNWDLHVGVNQVVYSAGRRGASVKLAEAESAAARIGVEQEKMDLAYETVQTFYAALFLEAQVSSLNQQLSDLEEHLAIIQKKRQTGSATTYDVLSTQASLASIQIQRNDAENQEQRQLVALKALTGIDRHGSIELSGSFDASFPTGLVDTDHLSSGSPDNAESYIAQALANQPQIKQALVAEDSARLNLQLAQLQRLPTLSASARVGYDNGLSLTDPNVLTLNWNVGVELSVPIFNGFELAYQIKQAQNKLNAARQNSAAIRRNITTEVLQAYGDLGAGREEVRDSLVQVNQAQEALDAAKVQYALGVITNVEYLDSETLLTQAKLDHLQAVYQQVLAQYELNRTLGIPIWESDKGSN